MRKFWLCKWVAKFYLFHYYRSIEETNSHRLNDSCFSSCGCNSSLYQPVCGENGLTYFSPCTAGCQKLSNETAVSMNGFKICTSVIFNPIVGDI